MLIPWKRGIYLGDDLREAIVVSGGEVDATVHASKAIGTAATEGVVKCESN